MWSSVALFVLTFAVLGLLLGFAAVYNTNQGPQTGPGAALSQNASGNTTEVGAAGNATISRESGQ
jgi:hypothetical protein